MSVGMSLVINSDFGFDRILCVYAGSECRKSTESSSTSSRTLRAALGSSVFLLCNFAEDDGESHDASCMAASTCLICFCFTSCGNSQSVPFLVDSTPFAPFRRDLQAPMKRDISNLPKPDILRRH